MIAKMHVTEIQEAQHDNTDYIQIKMSSSRHSRSFALPSNKCLLCCKIRAQFMLIYYIN